MPFTGAAREAAREATELRRTGMSKKAEAGRGEARRASVLRIPENAGGGGWAIPKRIVKRRESRAEVWRQRAESSFPYPRHRT